MIESPGGGYAVEMWLSEDNTAGLLEKVEREVAAETAGARARGRTALTVEVHEGVARLAGRVSSWAEKLAARRGVMRVPGILGVDDSAVKVEPDATEARSDPQLVRMVRSALHWDGRVPHGCVRVSATDGRVTLSGTVDHDDHRTAAVDTVARLVGVRDLTNAIVVPPRPGPSHPLARIEEELLRGLGREARHVHVSVSETGVELTGRVSTLELRGAAERAVRRVLGDVVLAVRLNL